MMQNQFLWQWADEKNLAPPFLKKAPPLKNKGGALAPPFRKKRVVACVLRWLNLEVTITLLIRADILFKFVELV